MVHFGRAFSAALFPTVLIVISWLLVSLLVRLIIGIELLSMVLYPLHLLLFLWAGHRTVKIYREDLANAGLAGLLAALLSGVFIFVLGLVLMMAGVGTNGLAAGSLDFLSVFLSFFFSLLVGMFVNFVVGLLGGFIAQKM